MKSPLRGICNDYKESICEGEFITGYSGEKRRWLSSGEDGNADSGYSGYSYI